MLSELSSLDASSVNCDTNFDMSTPLCPNHPVISNIIYYVIARALFVFLSPIICIPMRWYIPCLQ